MDKIDYLILSELSKNAQASFLKIAKKIGVSSFTVKSRYDKMKKEGIIKRTVVNIDLSKLGYQGKAFLLITNAPNTPKSVVMEELKKIVDVIVVSEIIGPFDIIAIAPIIDLNSIRKLVNEIKRLSSVQRVQITCIDDTMFPVNATFGKVLSEQCLNLAMLKHSSTKK
jgi:DNA-binding Lrp family transcriptional regulator